MDLLKNNSGFSVIETLVTIIILSSLIAIASSVINRNVSNNNSLKFKAMLLIKKDMDVIINQDCFQDTNYSASEENIKITRKVQQENNIYKITVSATRGSIELLTLTRINKR